MSDDIRKGGTSASNAQADELCWGRHLAQVGLPDTDTKDAKFGREIHTALAAEDGSATHPLDTQQRDIFDSCREIEKKKIAEFFGGDAVTGTRVFREQRYWCKVRNPAAIVGTAGSLFDHSGQPDMVMRRGPRMLIVEYKTLPGDLPDSPSNMQLRDQAVLASGNLIANEVGVVIVQPLVTHNPTITVYDADALKRAEQEMFERVRRSNDPSSPRTAGEVQCKFCKARNQCGEHARWRSAMLPDQPTPFTVQAAQWTLEQRSTVAEHLPRLKRLLADSEAFLKECLTNDPESVPGFWLEPGDTRTSITDVQGLFNRFSNKGGTLEQFMQCIGVTKGKLEGQIRDITKTKGKGLKVEMDKLLEGITESKQNSPSLAKKKEGV